MADRKLYLVTVELKPLQQRQSSYSYPLIVYPNRVVAINDLWQVPADLHGSKPYGSTDSKTVTEILVAK